MATTQGRNSRGGYVYKPRSEKQNKARVEQTGQRFDSIFKQGFDTYRPKAGDNAIRILPPTWDGYEHYGFDAWVHSYVGVDKGSYLCLKKMKGEACPICDAADEAKEAGENDDAQKMGATRKVAVWLLDRNADDLTPLLYAMPWGTDREIMQQATDPRSGKTLMIDHPDEGYDVLFKRTGEGIKTKYTGFKVDREPTPIADKQKDQDEVMELIQKNSIPDVLNYFPHAYLEKIMAGTAEEKDPELDEVVDSETGEVTAGKERRARGLRDGSEESGDEVEETDQRPTRRHARDADETADSEGDTGRRGGRSGRRQEPKTEEEQEALEASQHPRRRQQAEEAEEAEERPTRRGRGRDQEGEDEEEVDNRSRRTSRREEPDPEPEDDRPSPRGRSRRAESAEDDDPPPTRRARR